MAASMALSCAMRTQQPSAPACETCAAAPRLQIMLLRAGAVAPAYHSAGAAGMDLTACPPAEKSVEIPPGEVRMVACGFAMSVPEGFEGQVRPRSGLASRHRVTLPNTPGTIDSDYRGEVMVPLINLGDSPFVVEPGMRIAQLVIAPVVQASIELCNTLDETQRGRGGFGSTGL